MVAEGRREVIGVRRERKEKLTAAELRAAGMHPDLVTRWLRLASLGQGNQTQATKSPNLNIPDARREGPSWTQRP